MWRLRGDADEKAETDATHMHKAAGGTGSDVGTCGGAGGDAVFVPMGSVFRQSGAGRAAEVRFSPGGTLLGCLAAGKSVEVYRVRGVKEAARKVKRRQRRAREKARARAANMAQLAAGGATGVAGSAARRGDAQAPQTGADLARAAGAGGPEAPDELEWCATVRCSAKVRSFAFSREAPGRRVIYTTPVYFFTFFFRVRCRRLFVCCCEHNGCMTNQSNDPYFNAHCFSFLQECDRCVRATEQPN